MNSLKNVHTIYASASGNVEIVIDTIADVWRNKGVIVTSHRVETIDFSIISENDLFIFATSTWEHGEINPRFWNILPKMNEADMTGKQAFLVGLGDHRYEPVYLNGGIDKFQEMFEQRGGQVIGDIFKIDGDPYPLLNNIVLDWAERNFNIIPSIS